MKKYIFLNICVTVFALSCNQPTEPQSHAETIQSQPDYLIAFEDTTNNTCGFKDSKGNIIIPSGKYGFTTTDTFRNYAIVAIPDLGFVGIDRKEKILYQVFPFDNGPDRPSEGLFRIVKDNKIGYADIKTGEVVIQPQYPCAYPFATGKAQVAIKCDEIKSVEYSIWESKDWFWIDKTGKKWSPKNLF